MDGFLYRPVVRFFVFLPTTPVREFEETSSMDSLKSEITERGRQKRDWIQVKVSDGREISTSV